MYPFKCKGSETHNFVKDLNHSPTTEYYCSICGVSQKEFYNIKEEMKEFSEDFENFLENLKHGKEKLYASFMYKIISKMHRTNQQDFFRILHLFIKNMAGSQTDLRNQDSIEWCKKISEIDANFPRI